MARVVVAIWTSLATLATGNVYQYRHQQLDPDMIQYRRVGMWNPKDSPSVAEPGDGKAWISADVSLERQDVLRPGIVQLHILHAKDLPMVGYFDPEVGERTYCCTARLKQERVPGCSKVGHMILNRIGGGEIAHWSILFLSNQSTAHLAEQFVVVESGIHYLMFSSCDLRTGPTQITGHTVWHNPYGFLPGELYMFMPFYGWMSMAYLVFAFAWTVACSIHWQDVLRLQNCISGVIGLGMIESACWHFDYESFNSGGSRNTMPVVLALLTSTTKKMLSRLLVLVVSLGYGVVRPTLGKTASSILWFGTVYFIFSALLDVVSSTNQVSEVAGPIRLVCLLPVTLLDGYLYYWIYHGLSRTLTQLSARRQSAKLRLYKRFSRVLLGYVVVCALWMCLQMVVIISDEVEERWTLLWVFDAFWQVLYLLVLAAMAILWRPSQNNMQYAYSDELAQEDQEEDDDKGPDMNLDTLTVNDAMEEEANSGKMS